MLLRSSSTPVLGSLISSISDSPNHHLHHHHQQPPEVVHHHPTNRHPQTTMPHSLNKVSFHQSSSQKFTFSCNSSPISPTRGSSSNGGFQRAQSEGNLEGLVNSSSNVDEFPKRSADSFLETIPSFSFHSSTNQYEDEESEAEELEEAEAEKCNFAFNGGMKNMYAYTNMGLQKEIDENSQMHLARGLGISGLDINFGGDGTYGGNGGGGGGYGCEGGDGDEKDLEEHYKRMVQENPGNPLCLRNYAEFLYQTKQDLEGAEEYYSRAILVDPKDGEILAQYAKLVWELHHDEDKAMGYFERAVQAAPVDSHVHAAYASFLWEIEDEDEDKTLNDPRVLPPLLQRGAMASATA